VIIASDPFSVGIIRKWSFEFRKTTTPAMAEIKIKTSTGKILND
jgi:hypothetical protein